MRAVRCSALRVSGSWSFPLAVLLWLRVLLELARVGLVAFAVFLAFLVFGGAP